MGELVRYADDFVVMCKTKPDVEAAERRVKHVMTRLGLELHPDKTRKVDRAREGQDRPGLESRGWRRGAPQDACGIGWVEKRLPGGLEARLALDPGIIVGMIGENPEQKLGEVALYEEGQWNASTRTYAELDDIVASKLLRDLASLL